MGYVTEDTNRKTVKENKNPSFKRDDCKAVEQNYWKDGQFIEQETGEHRNIGKEPEGDQMSANCISYAQT